MSFPKVLILGQTFNKKDGGGVTMSNLFKGWPKDKLAVAATVNLSKDIDTSVCEIYYQLGYKNKQHPFPLNIILPKIKIGIIPVSGINNEGVNKATPVKTGNYKTIYSWVTACLHFFGLFNIFYKSTVTPQFETWLNKFDPDIIYTQLASLELIRFTDKIHERSKKPLVIHMMDDWPSTISKTGLFKNYWHRVIEKELKSLTLKATLLLSISETMAQEYQKRYARSFITFHNPIEVEFWKSHQKKNYQLQEDPVILYAGRIGKGINKTLETMAMAINAVNTKLNTRVQFIIQSPERPAWISKYRYLTYKAPVPYSTLPQVFAEADILYLPYDFTAESIRFIKYSMPTKAPEYMASGTPIMMFAPAETGLVIDALQGKWAKVVTQNKVTLLSEAIASLLTDEHERKQIATNAVNIAEKNYNSIEIRNRFKEVISSTVINK